MFDDYPPNVETPRRHRGRRRGHRTGSAEHVLSAARPGDELHVVAMHGGEGYRRQLMDMGLRPGSTIRVLRAGGHGPLLISTGETRLGIGRGMADKIQVAPITSDQ